MILCMWGSLWAAASDKPAAYQVGALIENTKLTPSFDRQTSYGTLIAYQVGPDRWRIGKLGKNTGIVFEIETGQLHTAAVPKNLRNIIAEIPSADPDAKALDK